jgi:hypothetical protein
MNRTAWLIVDDMTSMRQVGPIVELERIRAR